MGVTMELLLLSPPLPSSAGGSTHSPSFNSYSSLEHPVHDPSASLQAEHELSQALHNPFSSQNIASHAVQASAPVQVLQPAGQAVHSSAAATEQAYPVSQISQAATEVVYPIHPLAGT